MAIPDRLNRLRQQLSGKGLDAVLISQPENYRYLSGFAGSAGVLLVTQDSAVLATDFIHLEQAKKEATGVETVRIKNITQGLAELMRGRQIQGLGFEADVWTFSQHRRMAEEAERLKIELVPTEGLVESLRAVKEDEETDRLVRAAEIADRAVEYAARRLRAGMSEKELAWETERFLRENGSEAVPFPIIVASGPNAALPHASPTERTISPGEPVVVDLGATVAGYSSDLTRTLCLGPRGDSFDKIYGLVLQAQMSALNNLEAGMKGGQVDSLARREIEEGGYGSAFGHGLGHGVGLAVHESPRLGPDSGDVVEEGMVFCIEPGIYLPEWGGVRIEDTVVLRDGRAEVLTKAGK